MTSDSFCLIALHLRRSSPTSSKVKTISLGMKSKFIYDRRHIVPTIKTPIMKFRYNYVVDKKSNYSKLKVIKYHYTTSVFSCNLAIKMAGSTSYTSLVFLLISIYYIPPTDPKSTQQRYPTGSLACKTYVMTKMDCSYRDLFEVPLLEQNSIIALDLSHNRLMNVSGAPFGKLQMLMMLDMSYNEISCMSSKAFKGLQSLKILNLEMNNLVDLPKRIFADLFNLLILIMHGNGLPRIPGETLAPLRSCQMIMLTNIQSYLLEIDLSGFQNLTNLHRLSIYGTHIKSITSDNILQPLSNLPLTSLDLLWKVKDDTLSIRNMFAPLTNISTLTIGYETLPALKSLDSPLQNLIIMNSKINPEVVVNTSLQVLQKWEASLKRFTLSLSALKRIGDHVFEWIPNLLNLDLSENQINHLGRESFYGLKSLLKLDLSHNSLSHVPSDALKVFSKYASLQHLDCSSNNIDEMIVQNAFSAVSTSITLLNLDFSSKVFVIDNINWTSSLRRLEDLTLTCNDCSSTMIIDSSMQLPSLKKLQLSTFSHVVFATPLCSLFPNLKVISISHNKKFDLHRFLLYEAVQGCSNVKELDLSGILQNTHVDDFIHLNITLFSLETLNLAFNKLTSVKQVFVISAPHLKHLDVAENLLTTIDDDTAYKFPELISLNVQNN